jgi:NADH dehydrogenase FAD-containing subunit
MFNKAKDLRDIEFKEPFKYAHLGSVANVGEWKGVYDSSSMGK